MKTDILSFLENEGLLRENSLHQINHLPKSYLWKKKWKKSNFQLLPLNTQTLLTVTLKLLGTLIQI